MPKPRLLDLFSGAGGAAAGYHFAGFDVTGVDINPQPRFPFKFIQADALTFDLSGYDVIHASPPCQRHSRMSGCRPGLASTYPDLIDPIRQRLLSSKLPFIIENVVGAPLISSHTLCGHMFGLELYRHRLFECSFPLTVPAHPQHLIPASKAGHWSVGTIISVAGHCAPMSQARKAMGIDWMNRSEMAESIPPAYTAFIGEQLMRLL